LLRVGLTGGLGVGKSTLGRFLAEKGAALCDADEVVAGLYRPGGQAVDVVVARFGEEVRAPSGGLDRDKLAKLVVANAAALGELAQLVHPLVQREIETWLQQREQAGVLVAVVEAALLVETGSFRRFHRLVVVTAQEEVRKQRIRQGGHPPSLVERLLAAQRGEEEKLRHAHYVVDNSGPLPALAEKAEKLWAALLGDAQRLALRQGLPQGPAVFF
jgi:dephospho-CoA kinase